MIDLPPKPAIIIPKPKEIVRPGDPRIVLPFALGGMIIDPYRFGGGADATISKLGENNIPGTNAASHTHTAMVLSASGHTIIGISMQPNAALGTISSVTANGVGATAVVTAASANERSALYIVSAGAASGNVVVTNSDNLFSTTVITWEMLNGSATPTHSGTDTDSNPATFALNIAAGGVAVAMLVHRSDAANSYTWTNLTENHDALLATGQYASGASAAFAAAQTGLSMEALGAAAGNRSPVMCTASFPKA